MKNTMSGRLAACLVGCAAWAALPGTAAAQAYSAVYAFGDSLSDNGNLFAATGGTLPQPGDYFQGRFSNGRAAVEYVAQGLGVGLTDFAYGGAQTGLLNGAMVAANAPAALQNTGMLSQVGFFQTALAGNAADPNALFFVWGGANDFQYLGYTPAVAQVAIQNLSAAIQNLYGLGARRFLVPNLPDLGITPSGLASGASTQLQQLSFAFNAGLGSALSQLGALPGVQITSFDIFSAQHALAANPGAVGLSNVTDPCFTGYIGVAGTQCSNPSGYMYWDRIHPSAVTHQILGQQMLAAVPEPGALWMMAAGLVALGAAARRRRAA